jgi:hypothetical protein
MDTKASDSNNGGSSSAEELPDRPALAIRLFMLLGVSRDAGHGAAQPKPKSVTPPPVYPFKMGTSFGMS